VRKTRTSTIAAKGGTTGLTATHADEVDRDLLARKRSNH
jgi:hypothetical protein